MIRINHTFLLRIAISIILLAHSIPTILDGSIHDFGNLFLNEIGFAPIGIHLAWSIKLSHIVAAYCLVFEKYVKLAGLITILILVAGIILVHFKEGWFVVGHGRNGIEFNFLLIFALLTVMFPQGLQRKGANNDR